MSTHPRSGAHPLRPHDSHGDGAEVLYCTLFAARPRNLRPRRHRDRELESSNFASPIKTYSKFCSRNLPDLYVTIFVWFTLNPCAYMLLVCCCCCELFYTATGNRHGQFQRSERASLVEAQPQRRDALIRPTVRPIAQNNSARKNNKKHHTYTGLISWVKPSSERTGPTPAFN